MRRLKKIAILGAVIFSLAVGGLLAGAHFFKDDIIAKVLALVNENVDVPIEVTSVDFSLIHDFPNASVLFEEVFIADRFEESDTLLHSVILTLEFDIWDMVNGRYTIDKVSLGEARLKLRTFEDGSVNYIFWKESVENDPDMTFAIDRLELSDTYFTYLDDQADVSMSSDVDHATMKGLFADGWMDMQVQLEGSNTDLIVDRLHYLKSNDIAFESEMQVNESGHDIRFETCVAEVGKVKTPITGRIYKEAYWMLDLALDGSLEIADLLHELPNVQKGSIDRHYPKGKVDFLLTIKGESSKYVSPAVDLAFDLRAGAIGSTDGDADIRKIKSKGRYTRSEQGMDKIQFAHFDGKVPQGDISYAGSISDFDHPYVMGKFSCDADFSDLLALSQQEILTQPRGNVKVDLDVKGHLPRRNFDITAKNRLKITGEAFIEDLGFNLKSNGYTCSGISTNLLLDDDRLVFDELAMTINDDFVQVKGYINGLWPFVLADGEMELVAHVHAQKIDWDHWAQANKSESGETSELNKSIRVQTNFEVDKFSYGTFKAEEVSGKFVMRDGGITVDPIQLRSCNGSLNAQLQVEQLQNLHWTTTCDAVINGVDVDQLFREFDQFGQEFLTDVHIKGKADARIHFEGRFDEKMEADQTSLRAEADFRIINGELRQHSAMRDIVNALREKNMLSSFVRTDELERQLRHLKFNTLENKIKIEKEVIYIPEMKIANNALDISLAGRHSFSNQIDYRMEFNLRDILVNKNNPTFLVEDDGLGHLVPLRMYGTVEDPTIEIDKEKTRENRREAIAEAKSDIRDFFSDPFGRASDESSRDDRSAVKVQLEGKQKVETIAAADAIKKGKSDKKKRWKVLDNDEDEEETEEDDF